MPKKIRTAFFTIQLIRTTVKAPIAHLRIRREKPKVFFADGLNCPSIQKAVSAAAIATIYNTKG